MNIKPIHPNFQLPVRASDLAGGYDLVMPEGGIVHYDEPEGVMFGLGFAAEVPEGYVAFLLPRSGKGSKLGVSLNNTVGMIDADYRGEWKVSLRVRNHESVHWQAGERLIQMVLVPALAVDFNIVDELGDTARGEGGFGSTGV